MKKLRKIRFLMYVLPLTFFYVEISAQIPKDANVIIVKGVAYEEVLNKLLDSGYKIETRDKELKTAKTENKVYPSSWNAAYRIHVRMKDTIAYLSGTFTAPYSSAIFGSNDKDPLFKDDPVYNLSNNKGETKKKSLPGMPFLWINRLALSFGKPVEYLKQ